MPQNSLPTTVATKSGAPAPLKLDTSDNLKTVAAATDALLTTIDASNTELAAAIGTVADAAWSGTGNGTVIAILKKIALNTTTP